MRIDAATAPSLAELRPGRKRIVTDRFPVYRHLTERLVKASQPPGPGHLTQDDLVVAHVLATCAGYAYSDAQTLSMIMARMGLEDNRCVQISEDVDSMLICSTAFLVQSRDGRVVILCYRGTRPTSLLDWLTDIDVDPERIRFALGRETPHVHAGFYRNVRATRYKVVELLERALAGHPVDSGAKTGKPGTGLEALYVTGHSLGGAMALLMGVMLKADPDPGRRAIADKLYPLHTFGQPMVGGSAFARACRRWPWDDESSLGDNVVRWIYRNDVVPRLPPEASGDFAHFGQEFQFRRSAWCRNRRPTGQLNNLLWLAATPASFLAKQLRVTRNLPFVASIDDHFPQHYVTRLAPDGVLSEFGD